MFKFLGCFSDCCNCDAMLSLAEDAVENFDVLLFLGLVILLLVSRNSHTSQAKAADRFCSMMVSGVWELDAGNELLKTRWVFLDQIINDTYEPSCELKKKKKNRKYM